MRLVVTRAAASDLDGIIDYIALDSPAAAEKVFRAIVSATEHLIDLPDMGHVGRLPDTREIPVAGLPYLIVYQVAADTMTILAVLHGARDLVRALAERRNETSRS
ncbi:type II toxin-antitoxin system RelE/ParE family toxin [Nitrobacter sp.]|uniref:type II toxin-antitoxin system RelE/ParE family toxin n=1 Tax=unclassified Nitrobacter TaxID=2620411 RepID=UPI00321F9B53